MSRFLVVGLGHFGSWAATALHAKGHEVIAIERDGDRVDRHAHSLTRGVVGDATDRALLERVGAAEVDAAIISVGEDLAASILVTMALRDLGVKDVYVKVASVQGSRALEAFDVRETIFPEREAAQRLAQRVGSKVVLEYVPLGPGYSLQEIAIPDDWLGKTLRELELRTGHGIQVVALHDLLTGDLNVVPDPDEPLKESDLALIVGRDDVVSKLLARSD